MTDFDLFNKNDLIRLDIIYSTKLGNITETIFGEFIQQNFSQNNPNYLKSITINQIINIYDYLENGTNHSFVERVIDANFLMNSKKYYNSKISNK